MKGESVAYYELAAQVLPVLALIVIFEVRLFGDWSIYWARGGDPEDARQIPVLSAVVALLYGGLFLFGEMAALNAVKDGKASGWDEDIVDAALLLYLAMIFFYPMQMHAEAILERTPARRLRLRIHRWQRKHKGDPGP